MADTLVSEESMSTEQHQGEDKMFAFELSPSQPHQPQQDAPTDPFAFDDAPAAAPVAAPSQADPFADLLETTPQSPSSSAVESAPAPPQGYELSNFSWDDTPAPSEAAASPQTAAPPKEEDDFASLFGDLNDTKK